MAQPPDRSTDFLTFSCCRGVPKKILRLADTNRDGVVSVEEMMNFIINITNPK